jgi:fructose-1-phosphate kinase PfkB-like protein
MSSQFLEKKLKFDFFRVLGYNQISFYFSNQSSMAEVEFNGKKYEYSENRGDQSETKKKLNSQVESFGFGGDIPKTEIQNAFAKLRDTMDAKNVDMKTFK